MDEVTTPAATPIGTTDESRRHLLEQFAERLHRRGVRTPDVAAVVSAARAEAFLEHNDKLEHYDKEVGVVPAVDEAAGQLAYFNTMVELAERNVEQAQQLAPEA